MKCHFGKYKDKELADIPSGYLRWCVAKIDPVLEEKYRFEEDGKTPLTEGAVKAHEVKMREFISAAEDELVEREGNE